MGFNFRVKVRHRAVTPSPSATVNVKREVSDNDLDLKFMHFCPDQSEFVDILSKEQLKRMIRERRNSTGRVHMTDEQRQRLPARFGGLEAFGPVAFGPAALGHQI